MAVGKCHLALLGPQKAHRGSNSTWIPRRVHPQPGGRSEGWRYQPSLSTKALTHRHNPGQEDPQEAL